MGWRTHIAQARNFLAVRKSWFGAGGEPVSPELAQARANVCLICPMNDKDEDSWGWTLLKQAVINRQSELKNILSLKVEREHDLKVCKACGCKIKLKIFVPITHISRQTPTTQLTKYDPNCWIRKETNH